MADSEPYPFALPPTILEWVNSNPLPTQLLSEVGGVLVTNTAFAELLAQLGRRPDDVLTDLLPTGWDLPLSEQGWFATLRIGECLVKQLRLGGQQRYTFHLVKLSLSGGACLCCMLMPSDDVSETRLVGILNSIACFALELDSRGNISYLNDALRERLGYVLSDLSHLKHLRQLWQEYRTSEMLRLLGDVDHHGQVHFRGGITAKDGAVIPMEICIVASQPPNNSLYLLTARDIAPRLAPKAPLKTALVEVEPDTQTVAEENLELRARLKQRLEETHLVYRSAAFGAVLRRVQHLAPSDTAVLIIGESGTGKQLIARSIHEMSRRAGRPLLTVDCAALSPALLERVLFGNHRDSFADATAQPQGLFEAATGGTLLLREIGQLSLPLQARLLRALEGGDTIPPLRGRDIRATVRVLATTSREVSALAESGKFRTDLLNRLGVHSINCVSLRERQADIHPLVHHFIDKFNRQYGRGVSGIDATTLRHLEGYTFPGNVRELERMVEYAFTPETDRPEGEPSETTAQGMPAAKAPQLQLFDGMLTQFVSFETYQRKYLLRVLDSTEGQVSGAGGAAAILGMHPQTLFSRLRKLGIRR